MNLFKMSREIHRVMQDPHEFDAFGSGAIENDVPAFVITIRRADDLLALSSHLRVVGKIGESIFKLSDIFETLLSPPFLIRVTADIF